MSLKTKISEELKSAMKEKNTVKLGILRVFKGEIERNEQTASAKIVLSDGDIIKIAKKLIEGIKETTKNAEEISDLEAYLPKQLSEDLIRAEIEHVKQFEGFTKLGDFMKHFKTHYDGQYDAKLLSEILRGVLV